MSSFQKSMPWFRRPAPSLIAAPAARLLAAHKRQKRIPYDLSQVRVLKTVIAKVNQNYVEPQRISYHTMLSAGLNAIQRAVSPVIVHYEPNQQGFKIQVNNESQINPVQDAISTILRRNHQLPASYPDDFSTEDQASILKEAQSATTTFRVLTFALGGIALLVGGIGIMNMMLVSVHERTREIGIRKSVGAGPWTVQAQFLIEAILLSTLGGIAGVLAGIGSSKLISAVAGWETLVDPSSLPLAFAVALGVGVFFGYYPARRAARLRSAEDVVVIVIAVARLNP